MFLFFIRLPACTCSDDHLPAYLLLRNTVCVWSSGDQIIEVIIASFLTFFAVVVYVYFHLFIYLLYIMHIFLFCSVISWI